MLFVVLNCPWDFLFDIMLKNDNVVYNIYVYHFLNDMKKLLKKIFTKKIDPVTEYKLTSLQNKLHDSIAEYKLFCIIKNIHDNKMRLQDQRELMEEKISKLALRIKLGCYRGMELRRRKNQLMRYRCEDRHNIIRKSCKQYSPGITNKIYQCEKICYKDSYQNLEDGTEDAYLFENILNRNIEINKQITAELDKKIADLKK